MKYIVSFFSIVSFVIILSITSKVIAQDNVASNSAIPDEQISQNIKDRIKKIATQSSVIVQTKRKTAFIGKIEKIANETLTIKSNQDIHLASVSASTSFVRLPGNKSITMEDVVIGDYAAALGFINGSEVLETKRILLFDEPPTPTKKTSAAGIIEYIDEDEEALSINSDGITIKLELTKNTNLKLQNGVEKTETTLQDLKKGQYVAVIYIPVTDEYSTPKALTILATSIFKEITYEKINELTTQNATSSDNPSNTPPELGL